MKLIFNCHHKCVPLAFFALAGADAKYLCKRGFRFMARTTRAINCISFFHSRKMKLFIFSSSSLEYFFCALHPIKIFNPKRCSQIISLSILIFVIPDSVNSLQTGSSRALLNYFVAAKGTQEPNMNRKYLAINWKFIINLRQQKKNIPFIVPPAPTSINQYLLNNFCKYDFSYIMHKPFFRDNLEQVVANGSNLFPSSGRFRWRKKLLRRFLFWWRRRSFLFRAFRIMMEMWCVNDCCTRLRVSRDKNSSICSVNWCAKTNVRGWAAAICVPMFTTKCWRKLDEHVPSQLVNMIVSGEIEVKTNMELRVMEVFALNEKVVNAALNE